MKYCRTYDGIYDTFYCDVCEIDGIQYCRNAEISFSEILKQSNCIEELCDAYVLYKNKHCCVVGDVEAKEMATAHYGSIYGSIWVFSNGRPILKSVAKINEKGELELL